MSNGISWLVVLDKARELLGEVESRREKFFVEIAQPIHDVFLNFCERHKATFADLERWLNDPSTSFDYMLRSVESRHISEADTWAIFERLEGIEASSRARLDNYFQLYVIELKGCLAQHSLANVPDISGIEYYESLATSLYNAVEDAKETEWGLHDRTESEQRKIVAEILKHIQGDFYRYHTNVTEAYLRLKQHCMT